MATPHTYKRGDQILQMPIFSKPERTRRALEILTRHFKTDPKNRRTACEIEGYMTNKYGRLVPKMNDIIADPDTDKKCIHREFQDWMIEAAAASDDHVRGVDHARRNVIGLYDSIVDSLARHGLQYTGIASYKAFDPNAKIIIPDNPRHRHMVEKLMQGVPLAAAACSMQLHVENPFPLSERLIWARTLIEQIAMPLIIALSANSYNPVATGVHSYRSFQISGIWSFRPVQIRSFDDYVAYLQNALDRGHGKGPHDIHTPVKLTQGTTEQRYADTQSDVRMTLMLRALMHAIAEFVFDWVLFVDGPEELPLDAWGFAGSSGTQFIQTAYTSGLSRLDVEGVAGWNGEMMTMERQFEWLIKNIGPVMLELGYDWELAHLKHVLNTGMNGAARQKKWFDAGLSLEDIVNLDNEHFMKSLEEMKAPGAFSLAA